MTRQTLAARLAAATALASLLATPAAADIALPVTVNPGENVVAAFDRPAAPDARLLLRLIDRAPGSAALAGLAEIVGADVPEGARDVAFAAPETPGSYRVVLEEAGAETDRGRLEVAAEPLVEYSEPGVVTAGTEFEIARTRQTGRAALLRITDPATGTLLGEASVPAGETATVAAPEATGRLVFSFHDAQTGAEVERRMITVDRVRAWLRTPFEVAPGAPLPVEWHGPAGERFAVRIEDGQGDVLAEATPGRPGDSTGRLALTAPERPGRYRVRYVNRVSGTEVSAVPILVR